SACSARTEFSVTTGLHGCAAALRRTVRDAVRRNPCRANHGQPMGRRDSRLATYGRAAVDPSAITRLPYSLRPLSLEWILPLPEGSAANLTLGLRQGCPSSAQHCWQASMELLGLMGRSCGCMTSVATTIAIDYF